MTALAGAYRILRRVCSTLTGATGFGIVAIVLIAALLAPWVATAKVRRESRKVWPSTPP